MRRATHRLPQRVHPPLPRKHLLFSFANAFFCYVCVREDEYCKNAALNRLSCHNNALANLARSKAEKEKRLKTLLQYTPTMPAMLTVRARAAATCNLRLGDAPFDAKQQRRTCDKGMKLSTASEKLLAHTSKPARERAVLALEDGTMFRGNACGAPGETFGEICFNTSLEGYLEVITDPSYAGQVVVMTYPQIGNYGMCDDDCQSAHPALRGLVVRDLCTTPSNWRSTRSVPDFLCENGIIAIEGIDTRALVRHIRDHGAQRAGISTQVSCEADEAALLERVRESESLVGVNLAKTVSCNETHTFAKLPQSQAFALSAPATPRYRVTVYDCGAKLSILQNLVRVGCELTVVPWNTPAEEVLATNPDGVFLSNGPGDPDAVTETFAQAEKLLGKVPVFGICLGHQMMSLASGARMEKLKYGHHGGNQPVMNLVTKRVEITAQNHGFGLVFPTLGPLVPTCSGGYTEHVDDLRIWNERNIAPVVDNPRFGHIRLTHVNLNDGTAEGIAFLDIPAFCVQYHPEAAPGPTDAHYLFTAFPRMMDGMNASDALNIDIAADRLSGWNFGRKKLDPSAATADGASAGMTPAAADAADAGVGSKDDAVKEGGR